MRNKDKISDIKSEYIKIPWRILELGLSCGAGFYFVYLMNCGEKFNPTERVAAKALGISRASVRKYRQELIDCKVISLVKAGAMHNTALYEFNNPKNWVSKV